MLIRCPECGELNDKGSESCTSCGYPFTGDEEIIQNEAEQEITQNISNNSDSQSYDFNNQDSDGINDELLADSIDMDEEAVDDNPVGSDEESLKNPNLKVDDLAEDSFVNNLVDDLSFNNYNDSLNNNEDESFRENQNIIQDSMAYENDIIGGEIAPVTSEEKLLENKKSFFRKKKFIAACIGVFVISAGIAVFLITGDLRSYNKGKRLIASGKYDEAVEIFMELDDYKDSKDMITQVYAEQINSLCQENKFQEAYDLINDKIPEDKMDLVQDSFNKSSYELGKESLNNGDEIKAIDYLEDVNGYEDSEDLIIQANYNYGFELFEEDNFENAISYFQKCGDYKDAQDLRMQSTYNWGTNLYNAGEYEQAAYQFLACGDYKDAKEQHDECIYDYGKECIDNGDWDEGIKQLSSIDYKDSKEFVAKYNSIQERRVYDGKFYYSVDFFDTMLNLMTATIEPSLEFEYMRTVNGTAGWAISMYGSETTSTIMIDGISKDEDGYDTIDEIMLLTEDVMASDNEADASILTMVGIGALLNLDTNDEEIWNLISEMLESCYSSNVVTKEYEGVQYEMTMVGNMMLFTAKPI